MLTVIIAGQPWRQFPATLRTRAYWLRFAREDPRDIQVWDTDHHASYRLI